MYRRSGRGRLLLVALFVLSMVIITLDFRRDAQGPLERVVELSSAAVAPVQRGFTAVARPVGDFFSAIGDLRNLRTTNSELQEEVKRLRATITQAEGVLGENERLRALLGLDEPWVAAPKVAAEVFADVPGNYKWAVYIDKGRTEGVRPDMAVVSAEGLVGKVIRAGDTNSVVLLLLDPHAAARARLSAARDIGVIRGNGADEALSMELVDPGARVSVGDAVVTAAYDLGIFPPGIPIGTVSRVEDATAGVEKAIEIEPAADFARLELVYVLLESGPRLPVGSRT